MKKKQPPKTLVTVVDFQLYLEARRELFPRGIPAQRLIAFVFEKISLRDPRVLSLLDEVQEWKNKDQYVDPKDLDHIYSLIESQLEERKKGEA